MSNIEAAKQLYNTCKNMDIDETMQLVLSADNAEEQEFINSRWAKYKYLAERQLTNKAGE